MALHLYGLVAGIFNCVIFCVYITYVFRMGFFVHNVNMTSSFQNYLHTAMTSRIPFRGASSWREVHGPLIAPSAVNIAITSVKRADWLNGVCEVSLGENFSSPRVSLMRGRGGAISDSCHTPRIRDIYRLTWIPRISMYGYTRIIKAATQNGKVCTDF